MNSSNLGLSLKAKRDLKIPDGWFGRPQTIIHLLPLRTKIESCIPQKAEQIAESLNFESSHNLEKWNFGLLIKNVI